MSLLEDVRSAKTHISLRIRAVWSESLLTACAFYSLRAIQKRMNKNPCHTGWMYRLIWVTQVVLFKVISWTGSNGYSYWTTHCGVFGHSEAVWKICFILQILAAKLPYLLYENTPIQIYLFKISPPKTDSFQIKKKAWYFSYFCSKHRF